MSKSHLYQNIIEVAKSIFCNNKFSFVEERVGFKAILNISFQEGTIVSTFSYNRYFNKKIWVSSTVETNKGSFSSNFPINSLSETSNFYRSIEQAKKIKKYTDTYETDYECHQFLMHISDFFLQYKKIIELNKKTISTPEYKFNKAWKESGLDEDFNLLDADTDDHFGLKWLANYKTSLSQQLANAGIYESLELLCNLQPNFLPKLLGMDTDKDSDNQNPFLYFLEHSYGTIRAKEIIENLLFQISKKAVKYT